MLMHRTRNLGLNLVTTLATNAAPPCGSDLWINSSLLAFRHDFVYHVFEAGAGDAAMIREGVMSESPGAVNAGLRLIIDALRLLHDISRQVELPGLGVGVIPDLIGQNTCISQQLETIIEPVVNGDTGPQVDADLGLTPSRLVDVVGYE